MSTPTNSGTGRSTSSSVVAEPRLVRCTEAEIRVLTELVRDGAENGIIAKRLHLSHDTVKTHLKRVTSRIQTPNRTALAVGLVRGDIVVRDLENLVHEF